MGLGRGMRVAAVAVLGAAMVGSAVTTASAAVTEKGRIHETWVDVYEPGEEFPAGCTFDFRLADSLDAWINVTGVVRGDGIWYFNGTIQETETFTNLANGKTFTRVHSGSDRDQKITDNGDGTLTLTVQATGPNTYYAGATRLFTDTGVVRYTLLIEHGGTLDDPSDDGEPTFVSLDKYSGLSQTDGRDFCEDLLTYLG